jgi:hypothetical protein
MPPTEQQNIEAFVSSIFQAELELYAVQAQFARQQLEEQIASGGPAAIWFAVQNALALAANASKLLWEKGAKEARKRLRDKAAVGSGSKLKARSIRDCLEHFDREVIRWAQKGTFFIQRDVGSMKNASPAGDEFGRFDPNTWEVAFLHRKPIDLKAVLDELDAIAAHLSPYE